MKVTILIRTAIALLLSVSIVASADTISQDLEKDIQAIIDITTPASERTYADKFLRDGPSAPGDGFVMASVAKNHLNKFEREGRVTMPMARTMIRFAQGVEFPKDTRQYAFLKLARLAERNKEVAALVRPLASEILKRDEDPLKKEAERHLKK